MSFKQQYLDSLPKKPKELDNTVERELAHGWLIPFLTAGDAATNRRWDYWFECMTLEGFPDVLPQEPIPEMDFNRPTENPLALKMLTRCLNSLCNASLGSDAWMGWDSFKNFEYFQDWLLYGFGSWQVTELPQEPVKRASMNLYQLFDLGLILLFPSDYWGYLFSECRIGRHNGFFPTPSSITKMMGEVTFTGREEYRDKTVLDPACGTGIQLLYASNRSLRLFGQDISSLMVKATLLNGYFYAPWLARPLWPEHTLIEGNTLANEVRRYWN